MDLGCVEFCLPGSLEEKLPYLEEKGLWLELANTGPRDLSALESYDVEVKAVQAYMLHEYPLLSKTRALREKAREHMVDTIRLAEEIDARSVLVVPTYGFELIENSWEECVSALRNFADAGMEILVEPLDPNRTSFLPKASEVAKLLEEVRRDNVAMVLDTFHIHESGEYPAGVIEDYSKITREVHLRDSGAGQPGMGALDFRGIMRASAGKRLCLEFQSVDVEDLSWALRYLEGVSP